MRTYRSMSIIATILASALVMSACSQTAAVPSPTVAAPASTVQTTAPTMPPTVPPVSPTAAPTPVGVASPTAAPSGAAASPAATGGPALADLAAKARTATEYSFDLRITSPGPAATGKSYVKGTKLRNETSVAGQNVVMIVDTATKVAYMLMPGQNAAVKADFSQIMAQAPNPTEQVSALPANSRFVGNETIDGKPAAVYEATTAQGPTRYAIWTERGLPLRVETTTAQGKSTIDFSNYQFGPQPDSLFQLPPGTQVIDMPAGLPGLPGAAPKPTP